MAKKSKEEEQVPWVEKYRPLHLKDVIGQSNEIANISVHLENKSTMNMLFKGDEGIGKTTVAMIVAGILSNMNSANVEYVNASMFGRQAFLQNEIIPFCKSAGLGEGKKVVILDEFDYASAVMQGSFRRVMEDYSARGNCVFILICNYERKVIKPIKSRCAIFEFKKVQIEDLVDRGKFILMKEKIIFKEEDILQLARDSEGKPRNFIMSLQKYSLDGELKVEKEASLDMHTKRLLTAIFKAEERDLERALEIYNEITRTISDNPRELVLDIHNMIVENKKMNRDLKGRVLKIISDVDFRISQDTNPYIQMTGLIVNLFILSTSFIQEMQKQNQK